MKVLFLLLTLFFSFSVLADCCNFEANSSVEYVDECGDHGEEEEKEKPKREQEHCDCSLRSHVKVFSLKNLVVSLPLSSPSLLSPHSPKLRLSYFVDSIFHPPIS